MKTLLLISILFTKILLAQTDSGILSVKTYNLKNDEGYVLVKLFRESDKIPTQPFLEKKEKIIKGAASFTFGNIPYNNYALIVCHDENSNENVDHNFLGIPSETLRFSNQWKFSLFSGMPTFNKLKFQFTKNNNECNFDFEDE
jgi:uncharacterized protein (DUF2141 family)